MTSPTIAARIAQSLVGTLPSPLAFWLTNNLASRPPKLPLKPRDEAVLATAKPFVWRQSDQAGAWTWGQEGPLIILVHGWGGRASQMAPMARFLSLQGFRTAAFDMSAHGSSRRNKTGLQQMIADIAAFATRLPDPIHAFVGHSAGGLCTMAARHAQQVQARHFVCLNMPCAPYVPIDMIKRALGPSPAVEMR